MSKLSIGSIVADSTRYDSPDITWSGHYDFALLSTSWDRRCVAITDSKQVSFAESLLIVPKTRDDLGLRDRHDKIVLEFLRRSSGRLTLLEIDTGDLGAWQDLKQEFYHALISQPVAGGARILIDLSTCPRFLSLALFREALNSGLVRSIDLTYSEGVYPPAPASFEGIEEISFRDGPIEATPVPGYLGDFEPGRRKAILASIGFDGWKTLNLVTREEPDDVAVILASPASAPDYEARTLRANSALIEKFSVDDRFLLKAAAGDAVDVARLVHAARRRIGDNANVYYLCAGNKPHSFGMALEASLETSSTLLYVRPTRHSPVMVDPSGVYWRYSVRQKVITHFSK